ncbi:hypothetical protein C7S18_04500 [Ahniella affigens]|uniref:Uncharacterized protein n=1 Tax=Ahniella affigens TaxID=2021234 RepID=A0A2P1PNS6_9GAMM|nr:hypothetical protein C7S18_04500 [Ahniella affigens]
MTGEVGMIPEWQTPKLCFVSLRSGRWYFLAAIGHFFLDKSSRFDLCNDIGSVTGDFQRRYEFGV